jgi:hypothetical protein
VASEDAAQTDRSGEDAAPNAGPGRKVVYGGEIQEGGGMVDPAPHVVTDDEDPEGLDPSEPEKDWTR